MVLEDVSSVGIHSNEIISRDTLEKKFNVRNTKVKLADLEIHEGSKTEHYFMKPIDDNKLKVHLIYTN